MCLPQLAVSHSRGRPRGRIRAQLLLYVASLALFHEVVLCHALHKLDEPPRVQVYNVIPSRRKLFLQQQDHRPLRLSVLYCSHDNAGRVFYKLVVLFLEVPLKLLDRLTLHHVRAPLAFATGLDGDGRVDPR